MQWPIFPENGLANSVIPPVLVGLSISTFFAETIGWNFSGLIVPGYLAPIFIVKPLSGVVIIVEALITYIILRILSDGFSRFGIWSRFFGQDAFFALLVLSILVKCILEGPMQPIIGDLLVRVFPGHFDFKNELHSTGLIVVPLMANIFWRHGIRKNLIPAITMIGLTYLILKFILLPFTNFSVNQFELMYSKMAVNFEESARYYFILIIGAALATHNKYEYGWSYHGMLIPALLGIAWLTPMKILTTFIEAGMILVLGVWIVRSRLMRSVTVEGPRKLLLLFFIAFVLKMGTGFVLASTAPGFQAMDLYGFAYILPALIAMEMWPGRNYIKVTRLTIQTSFLAALLGVMLCGAIDMVAPEEYSSATGDAASNPDAQGSGSQAITQITTDFVPWLYEQLETRLSYGVHHKAFSVKRFAQMDQRILTPMITSLSTEWNPNQSTVTGLLEKTGYQIANVMDTSTGNSFYVLFEKTPTTFQGIYVFRTGSSEPVAIQVPNPLTEHHSLELGLELFHQLNGRALLISGTSRRKEFAEFDVTHIEDRRSLFQLVHQVIHRENIETDPVGSIQVRGADPETALDVDVILSSGIEIRNELPKSTLMDELDHVLKRNGIRTRWYRGEPDDINYSTRSITQQAYVDSFDMGEFVAMWALPKFRTAYARPRFDFQVFDQLGWSHQKGSFDQWAIDRMKETPAHSSVNASEAMRREVVNELAEFCITENILHLERLTDIAQHHQYQVMDYMDTLRDLRYIVFITQSALNGPTYCFHYFSGQEQPIILDSSTLDSHNLLNRFHLGRCESLTIMGNGQ